MYRPRRADPVATVVGIHGGRWQVGDRTTDERIHVALAEAGAIVVSPDVRSSAVAPFPGSVDDARDALTWARARYADDGPVGMLGCSSGGHVAMCCALDPSCPVDFVIACWAVLDPERRRAYAVEAARHDLLTATDAYFAAPGSITTGNPQALLDRGRHGPLPPALLIHGLLDENVPVEVAERFAASYRAEGGQLRLVFYPDAPHSFVHVDPASPQTKDALDRIVAFVTEHGRRRDANMMTGR